MYLKDAEEEIIINVLTEKLSPQFIYLFGTAAAGKLRSDSDVDIAFFSNDDMAAYEVFILAQELAAMIGRDVDLINLREASTVLKAQIVGTGKVIYEVSRNKTNEFQIRVLKEYALLNEERQEILERIYEREEDYE